MLPLSTIEAQEPEEVQTKPPKKGGETGKLWAGGSGEVSTRWGSMDPSPNVSTGSSGQGPPGCGLPDITSRQQVTTLLRASRELLGAEPVWAPFCAPDTLISYPSPCPP